MTEFVHKIRDAITRHNMLAPGERVLIAVSGGPDSMALMHAMDELRDVLSIEVFVAHFDHGLRPESPQDAEFVKEAAEGRGLEFVSERAELSRMPGNIQSLARNARYGFLRMTATRLGCGKVATGHTMDDQAETYLMREIRGSGTGGLKSIPPVRDVFIRPLIQTTRADIIEYLASRGIKYLTDPTNRKPVYLRNRVRMELLPLIEVINPNAVETLAREADIALVEDSYMDAVARDAFDDAAIGTGKGGVSLDAGTLLSMHPAVRRRVIREAVLRVKGDLLGVTYGHVMDVEILLEAGHTGKGLDLPGGVRFELSYDRAVFSKNIEQSPYEYTLTVPGVTHVPEAGINLFAEHSAAGGAANGRESALVDMDMLTGPLSVRSRKPGDRFRPAGMDGKKKLKDYFMEIKLPVRERDTAPLLVSGEEIVWVVGHRQDGRFVARSGSVNVLRIFFEPEHA